MTILSVTERRSAISSPLRITFLASCMVLALTAFQNAEASTYAESLDNAIQSFVRSAGESDPEVLNADQEMLRTGIRSLWEKFGRAQASAVTSADVGSLIQSIWNRKLITRDQARTLAQDLFPRATDADTAERQFGFLLLLHPFVKEAGMCRADPTSPNTELCIFSVGKGSANGAARF